MQPSSSYRPFAEFVQELVAIIERLPVPTAIALDAQGEQIRVNPAFSAMFAQGERPKAFECLIAAAAGTNPPKSSLGSAWPLLDDAGAVCGSIAVYRAVTGSDAEEHLETRYELRAAEDRYRLIAEAMPQFVWIAGADGGAVYANGRWLDYTGMSAEENAGFGGTATVHPDDAARLDPLRALSLKTGEDFEGECRYKGKDGKYRWFLFRSIAVRDGDGNVSSWVGTATDIDRQKRAEAQQTFFATASQLLGSTLDEQATLEGIAQLCVPKLADWCAIDLVPEDAAKLQTVIIRHADPAKNELLQCFLGDNRLRFDSEFGAPNVVRTGESQMFGFIDDWMIDDAVPDPQDRKIFTTAGYSSAVVVPLKYRERVYGALTLMSADPSHLYTAFDLTTAMEFARRGAIAIEHSRLFEREHLVATTLQRALLPAELPNVENIRFSWAYSAAVTGEAVGGDWYDAFELPNGRIALSVGDVAGHGLTAAVTMGTVRQAIRTAALERSHPGDVLLRANAALALDRRDTMVTAIFATYEPRSRLFEYAIAGHPRPLVAETQGKVYALEGGGPPLGSFFDRHSPETLYATLPRGASVVFFTDGLIEFDRDLERAEARLMETLQQRRHALSDNPAAEIIARVLDAPQRDDIAVLIMTLQAPAEIVDVVLPSHPRAAPIARGILREFAQFHHIDDERTFNALAAAGEAVANAIEHPYDGSEGTFRLRAAMIDKTISLEIADQGKWRSSISVNRGRGFTIMRGVSQAFELRRSLAGTSVFLKL